MKSFKIQQRPTDRSEKSVVSYFDAVSKQPTITPEEEKDLIARIHLGDNKAKERLICGNLRFVISIAKQFQDQGLPLSDLIEEGNYGLIKAAEKYSKERDNRFISYAVWWIMNSIQKAIHDYGRTIRLPKQVHLLYKYIIDFQKRYESMNGQSCSLEEIANELGLSSWRVNEIIATEGNNQSLDSSLFNDEKQSLLGTLAQECYELPEVAYEEEETNALLHLALDTVLSDREEFIIRSFFGLDGDQMSAQEIGTKLNLTRERVRQILKDSFTKIRRSRFGKELRMCC